MRKIFLVAFLNLLSFVNFPVFASDDAIQNSDIQTSFNCHKANNALESLICSDPELCYLDNRMATYFKLAMAKSTQAQEKVLLKEQKKWLKNRTSKCMSKAVSDQFSAKSCLSNYYKKRNFELFKKIYALNNSLEPSITVTSPLSFADFDVIGKVSKNLLAMLPSIKIDGGGQFLNGFKAENDIHLVRNCAEYWKYGIDAENTYEISMEGWFSQTCDPLEKLLIMKAAKISYLHNISITDDKWMSLSFLPLIMDEQQKDIDHYQLQGITVSDLIKMGKVQLTKNSPYSLDLIYDGSDEKIDEIARGDFTGDGTESILVNEAVFATTGSYRTFSMQLITRSGNNQLLQLVNIPQ